MRAVIGVDGSPESFAAVQFASQLMAAEKDELILYYSPPPIYVREVPDARATVGSLQSYLAHAVFEKARQNMRPEMRSNSQTIVGTHDPRSGILIAADDRRADLIAIGARGVGPQRATSIGSTARQIVHHSTIPVLVVRGAAVPSEEPLRVLLASDGTEVSKHAVNILRSFSWPLGTTGRILAVIEPSARSHVPGWLLKQLDEEQLVALGVGRFERDKDDIARTRQELLHWCGTLPPVFNCEETLVVVGHASQEILGAADANHTHLIVLGARKQGTVRRALLGSTSEEVLTHASCSVLIAPQHERP